MPRMLFCEATFSCPLDATQPRADSKSEPILDLSKQAQNEVYGVAVGTWIWRSCGHLDIEITKRLGVSVGIKNRIKILIVHATYDHFQRLVLLDPSWLATDLLFAEERSGEKWAQHIWPWYGRGWRLPHSECATCKQVKSEVGH